jgi:hypothetical protein
MMSGGSVKMCSAIRNNAYDMRTGLTLMESIIQLACLKRHEYGKTRFDEELENT